MSEDWPSKRIPFVEFAEGLARRRAEYEAEHGRPADLPRNAGNRRTASKRALLKAIEDAGGKW